MLVDTTLSALDSANSSTTDVVTPERICLSTRLLLKIGGIVILNGPFIVYLNSNLVLNWLAPLAEFLLPPTDLGAGVAALCARAGVGEVTVLFVGSSTVVIGSPNQSDCQLFQIVPNAFPTPDNTVS
jgi:hypothetical protein